MSFVKITEMSAFKIDLSCYILFIKLRPVFDLVKFILIKLIQAQINEETSQAYTYNTQMHEESSQRIIPIFPRKIMMNLIYRTPKNTDEPFWLKLAAKCDIPFFKLNIYFGSDYQVNFLNAIKNNDFDVIRAFILIFSPNKLHVDICNIKDISIQNKLFDATNIKVMDRFVASRIYIVVLPLFLLPILGANQDTTKKVFELLIKLQDLPYRLYDHRMIATVRPVKHHAFDFGYNRGDNIKQIMEKHIPEFLKMFTQICEKNDEPGIAKDGPVKHVIGTLITY